VGGGAHVGNDVKVVDAIDGNALVIPSLAASAFTLQTSLTFTARGQFKRSVVWLRSKSGHRPGSSNLVVAQVAATTAVIVVVVVGRLWGTSLFLVRDVVVEPVVVGNVFVAVILAMVATHLIIARVGSLAVNIIRWFAVAARLLLAEASVVAFVAQRSTSWYGTPERGKRVGLPTIVASVPE
jgi:hypothetical protein